MNAQSWMKNFPLGRLKEDNEYVPEHRKNKPTVKDPYKRSLLDDFKAGFITKEELSQLLAEYQENQETVATF